MKYRIELSREAASDVDRLHSADRKLCQRIINKLETLAGSSHEGKPLVGNHKGEFSLRVGDYRIVYELDPPGRSVVILTIKHRKHAYP